MRRCFILFSVPGLLVHLRLANRGIHGVIDIVIWQRKKLFLLKLMLCCIHQVAVRKALVCIGDSIFRGQPPVITWFRIVALFAVSAAVAREVVVNGNAHLVPVVVATFTELVDRYLAVWIYRQGGWVRAHIFVSIFFYRLCLQCSLLCINGLYCTRRKHQQLPYASVVHSRPCGNLRRDFDRPNTFAVRFSLVQFGSLRSDARSQSRSVHFGSIWRLLT